MQATGEGSDQTARMRRLIWGFVGRTYHIVGNLDSWLNYTVFAFLALKHSQESADSTFSYYMNVYPVYLLGWTFKVCNYEHFSKFFIFFLNHL